MKKTILGLAALATVLSARGQAPAAETRHPAEPEMVFVEGGTFLMGSTHEDTSYDPSDFWEVSLGFRLRLSLSI
jgi:formylglycine-generating enzyme required for sulfatase activity